MARVVVAAAGALIAALFSRHINGTDGSGAAIVFLLIQVALGGWEKAKAEASQ